MSDWSVIRRTLQEIREFLHNRLDDQFMGSAQAAMKTINQVLGDPNIQANLKDTLNKLGPLLQEAKDTKHVEKAAGAMQEMQKLLNEVDPKDVGDAFKNIKLLSKEHTEDTLMYSVFYTEQKSGVNTVQCLGI